MEKPYDILDHLYKDFNKGNVGRFTTVLAEGIHILNSIIINLHFIQLKHFLFVETLHKFNISII